MTLQSSLSVDIEALQRDILETVSSYVGAEVPIDEPLSKLGLDSLAAMELRQKLQACFVSYICLLPLPFAHSIRPKEYSCTCDEALIPSYSLQSGNRNKWYCTVDVWCKKAGRL